MARIRITEGTLELRRAAQGMTEEQVAEKLGTTQPNAHRWLTGKRQAQGKWRGAIEDEFGVGARSWDAIVWEGPENAAEARA